MLLCQLGDMRFKEWPDFLEIRDCGIVDSERQGLWAYYYVNPEALEELSAWLS